VKKIFFLPLYRLNGQYAIFGNVTDRAEGVRKITRLLATESEKNGLSGKYFNFSMPWKTKKNRLFRRNA